LRPIPKKNPAAKIAAGFFCKTGRRKGYIVREHFPPQPHPAGGAENPPAPLGIPFGRTHPADISFCTRALLHSGHAGSGSQQDLAIDSNRWLHSEHWYSYNGMGFLQLCLFFGRQENWPLDFTKNNP
jgi:hypothetical protein